MTAKKKSMNMEIIEIISEHSDYIEQDPLALFYCLYFCIYYKNPDLVEFLRTLIQKMGNDNKPEKISFGSEAGLFGDQVKIPCVVCGPGSILQAHRPDEYVEEAQLMQCWRFIGRLVSHLQSRGLQY